MTIRIETQFDQSRHGDALLDLMTQYAADITGKAEPLPEIVRKTLVQEIVRRPNVHVFLAYVGSVPAGFAITIDSFSTFACKPILNVHDIFVGRKFRGGGLAKALLRAIDDRARAEGCCKVTLEVLENNTPALRLYTGFGFAPHVQDPVLGKGLFYEKKLD